MPKTLIYVIRHGQTTHNRDSILSGHVDPELTEEGIKQVETAREKLSHIHFDEVYSSDLQRAAKTAQIVSGRPVHLSKQLPGLRERNYGEIDGKHLKHMTDLVEKHSENLLKLNDDQIWKYKFAPYIESDHELANRFVSTLYKIAEENEGKTILVGAHGGTVRSMLVELGYAKVSQLPRGSIANAAFAVLSYDGKKLTVVDVNGIEIKK